MTGYDTGNRVRRPSLPHRREKTGRCARLIEYDPLYRDKIVKRWAAQTGKRARLPVVGERFEGLAETRLGINLENEFEQRMFDIAPRGSPPSQTKSNPRASNAAKIFCRHRHDSDTLQRCDATAAGYNGATSQGRDMRTVIIAVTAIAAMAGSASAADRGPYFGVEGGIMIPRNTNYRVDSIRVQTVPTGSGLLGQSVTTTRATFGSGFVADHKAGFDFDVLGGYDFGLFRLEGELGYKRARVRDVSASPTLVAAINTAPISGVGPDDFAFGERTTVLSAMVNALVDFEIAQGINLYGGGGIGKARVKAFNDRDNALALQLIGGISTALSPNIDVGIKYRYFRTGNVRFASGATFAGAGGSTSASAFVSEGKFRSHSALVGLTFHFGAAAEMPGPAAMEAAPPPPPPPLPPVITQTCDDGSVIEATAVCPAPVPPPSPPAAEPERG